MSCIPRKLALEAVGVFLGCRRWCAVLHGGVKVDLHRLVEGRCLSCGWMGDGRAGRRTLLGSLLSNPQLVTTRWVLYIAQPLVSDERQLHSQQQPATPILQQKKTSRALSRPDRKKKGQKKKNKPVKNTTPSSSSPHPPRHHPPPASPPRAAPPRSAPRGRPRRARRARPGACRSRAGR